MFSNIVETVLTRFGLEYKPISGGRKYLMRCPFHTDRKSSFTVTADTGLYGCFSCGVAGPDIKHFLKRMSGEDVDIREFITEKDEFDMKLNNLYLKSSKQLAQIDDYVEFLELYTYVSQSFIPALDNPIATEYLMGDKRKLSKVIIEKYGLKYCTEGKYENRIIIPYTLNGRVIGFNSRLIGVDKSFGKEMRYLYLLSQKDFDGFLYNYNRDMSKEYCILVEGPFDLMYMVQCGFKNVISTLNTRVNIEHIMKMTEFQKIIFCFDNDENGAGFKSVMKSASYILGMLPEKPIYYVELPQWKDPNECSPHELRGAFGKLKKLRLKQ